MGRAASPRVPLKIQKVSTHPVEPPAALPYLSMLAGIGAVDVVHQVLDVALVFAYDPAH